MSPVISIANEYHRDRWLSEWLNNAPKTRTTETGFAAPHKFHFPDFRRLYQFALDLRAGKGFNFLKNINWRELQTELKKGNNEMLAVFFRDHAEYCTRKLTREHQCTKEDAEDIFIESVMSLREKLIQGSVDTLAHVRSYLFKTCHYMLMDRLRKKDRQDRAEPDIARFFYESNHVQENDAFDQEMLKVTRVAWSELSEKCKDILHYFYVERLEMKEIAELMAFASADVAKTSKSRCFRHFSTRADELKQSSIDEA